MHSGRSQWSRGLRRRSAAARLPRSWVRIPPVAWMFVCCECYVLSGRGLCDELITRPEESSRLWCVVVCDLETSRMRRPLHALGRSATKKKRTYVFQLQSTFRCSAGVSCEGVLIMVCEVKFFVLFYLVIAVYKLVCRHVTNLETSKW